MIPSAVNASTPPAIARGHVNQESDGRGISCAADRSSARAILAWNHAVASSTGRPMARRLKPAGKNQDGIVKC